MIQEANERDPVHRMVAPSLSRDRSAPARGRRDVLRYHPRGMPHRLALLFALYFLPLPAASSETDLSRLLAEKNLGLAALEEGDDAQARKRFETVRKLAPEEPL